LAASHHSKPWYTVLTAKSMKHIPNAKGNSLVTNGNENRLTPSYTIGSVHEMDNQASSFIIGVVRVHFTQFVEADSERVISIGHNPLWPPVDLYAIERCTKVKRVSIAIVVLHVLICGKILHGDNGVIDGEQKHSNKQDEAVQLKEEVQRVLNERHDEIPQACICPIVIIADLPENVPNTVECQYEEERRRVDQCDKVAVVVKTDARTEPGAVMVEAQDAVVTKGTVFGAWWSVDMARPTELLPETNSRTMQQTVLS